MIGWALATLGALLVSAVLAKLGQVAPQPGGPCAYAEGALGRYMGFQAYAIYWLCALLGNIAIAVAVVGYLAHFFPTLALPLHAALAATGAIWLLTLANIAGPRFACQLESATLAIGLIPLALVGIAGWWFFDAEIFRASWNITHQPLYAVVPGSLVLVFWAFLGLESASISAAVVDNPQRNVPLATLGGVLVTGLVYTAACGVIMGLIPATQLAKSTAPFADAAQLMVGPLAGSIVALAALLKASGTLCGWVLLTAQVSKAGSDRGFFPAALARVDRDGVPVINLLIQAVLMSGVVFATMSPTLNQQFNKLVAVSVILSLLIYLYGSVAVWQFHIEGYRVIAMLAMLFCLGVIVMSGTQLLALTAVILLATCLLYPLVLGKEDPRSTPRTARSRPAA